MNPLRAGVLFERRSLSVLLPCAGSTGEECPARTAWQAEIGKADLKHDCVGARDTAPPAMLPAHGRGTDCGPFRFRLRNQLPTRPPHLSGAKARTAMRQPKHAQKPSTTDFCGLAAAIKTRRYGLGAGLSRVLFRIKYSRTIWKQPKRFSIVWFGRYVWLESEYVRDSAVDFSTA